MTFTTRPALAADYGSFVTLFAELGLPDPTPSAAAFEAMFPRLLVAVEGDVVVGYARWRIYGALAHVANIVSAPERRGRGIGRLLMDAVRVAVIAEGATRWYLYVKDDNVPALRLYERAGLTPACAAWTLECAWSMRARLPESPPTEVFVPVATEAVALGIQPDHFAFLDARGLVLRGLRVADEIVAAAAFDPRYPGVYPFAARSPIHARALLDALHPHRDPEHGELLRISLDRDAAIAQTLIEAGATVTFALLRLHGALA